MITLVETWAGLLGVFVAWKIFVAIWFPAAGDDK